MAQGSGLKAQEGRAQGLGSGLKAQDSWVWVIQGRNQCTPTGAELFVSLLQHRRVALRDEAQSTRDVGKVAASEAEPREILRKCTYSPCVLLADPSTMFPAAETAA